MMNKNCARCGKPVYFAERKTSLGREWHPSCLKCERCGKVLSPGQHAEHKSLPYCHNPCYKALYGPAILGYGSNISSPANFARPDRQVIYGPDLGNGFNEIFRLENSQANKGANSQKTSARPAQNTKLHEILQKIEEFNQYHEGKVHHQMTAEEMGDGSVHVEGPLRIYWGLSQPIQLVHCDNIPPAPIAHWRHSLCVGPESPDIPEKKFSSTLSFRAPHSPSGKSKELDDMFSSPSSPDDVVRRKKQGVRKFKTVAYRGDQPTKWKRASINGHLFNYDTSVFTPVLGSCTSVNVHSSLTSGEVIETLLEKFKVQNSPDEYVLSIVSEEGERILSRTDKPLLERLKLGPNETLGKIFIREAGGSSVTHSPNSVKTTIAETAEEENIPHEVEQLLVLPEAVLRGILEKFFKDEEKEVQTLKARYERCKKRIQQRLQEIQSFESSSRA